MSFLEQLPAPVSRLIETRYICEWASVSKAGVPIDSPLVPFHSPDNETIDCATGLAYPVKAERARNNPKIGLLMEGGPDEPVVSIGGYAGVKDRDFQANLERYLSEQILTPMLHPDKGEYSHFTRHALHYFTRIVVCVKPAVVRWWDDPAAMDGPPHEWRAPAGTQWPQSDHAPGGAGVAVPWNLPPDWRAMVRSAIGRKAAAHLTLIDAEGFPLPIRARDVQATDDGLQLVMPGWLPWRGGKATVSFEGIEVLVGNAELDGSTAHFHAERALPLNPLLTSPEEILRPSPATREALMTRIRHELDRRGCALPRMPDEAPAPTAGARLRHQAAHSFGGFASGEG